MKGLTKCSHHLIPSFFLLIFNILLFYLGHVSMTKWPINCLWTLDSKKQKKKKKKLLMDTTMYNMENATTVTNFTI